MRSYGIYEEICPWPKVVVIGLLIILACIALVGGVSGKRVADGRASQAVKQAPIVRESKGQGDKASMVNKHDDATTSQAARRVETQFSRYFLPEYGHVYAVA